MKRFKKFTAIALSSLGILTSAPSAFCAPKGKLSDVTKSYEVTSPTKRDSKLKLPDLESLWDLPPLSSISHSEINKKNSPKQNTPNINFYNQVLQLNDEYSIGKLAHSWSKIKLPRIVSAPFAGPKVEEKAFLNQVEMTRLYLPKVCRIDEYAFEGCRNLNVLFLTSSIESVSPRAFERCSPYLKIVWCDSVYTVPEFLSMFASVEEDATTYNYAVNTDEEILSFYNIARR